LGWVLMSIHCTVQMSAMLPKHAFDQILKTMWYIFGQVDISFFLLHSIIMVAVICEEKNQGN